MLEAMLEAMLDAPDTFYTGRQDFTMDNTDFVDDPLSLSLSLSLSARIVLASWGTGGGGGEGMGARRVGGGR